MRVRIRRQTALLAGYLLPEPVKVIFRKSAFQKRPRIHAGGGVPLEEHLVAPARMVLTAEEIVKAHLVQRGGARIGGNVATDTNAGALGPVHHHRGIPPNPPTVPLLDLFIARELRLHRGGDRINVICRRHCRERHPLGRCPFQHSQH